MSLESRDLTKHQTPWPCGHGGAVWWANVHTEERDEAVLQVAKWQVDQALPQKLNTYFGGHYYSFVTREYLLNLILFYREAHGQFPQGAVCIVERWAWQGEAFNRAGRWVVGWFWRFMRREDFKSPGFWVHLPSVQGFDQSAETNQSN